MSRSAQPKPVSLLALGQSGRRNVDVQVLIVGDSEAAVAKSHIAGMNLPKRRGVDGRLSVLLIENNNLFVRSVIGVPNDRPKYPLPGQKSPPIGMQTTGVARLNPTTNIGPRFRFQRPNSCRPALGLGGGQDKFSFGHPDHVGDLDSLSFPQFFTGPSVQAKDAVKVGRAREHSAGIINHWVQSSGRWIAVICLQSSTGIT